METVDSLSLHRARSWCWIFLRTVKILLWIIKHEKHRKSVQVTHVQYKSCCYVIVHCIYMYTLLLLGYYQSLFWYAPPRSIIVYGLSVYPSIRSSVPLFVVKVQVQVFCQCSFWWCWNTIDLKLSIRFPYSVLSNNIENNSTLHTLFVYICVLCKSIWTPQLEIYLYLNDILK